MCFFSRPNIPAPPPPAEIKLPEPPPPAAMAEPMTQARPKTPTEGNPLFRRRGKKALTIQMGSTTANLPGT
jgi:hypothetical protein